MMIKRLFGASLAALLSLSAVAQYADKVNPFIGTSNYGTTQPGPVVPGGMVSMSAYNTIPRPEHRIHWDNWCSTPYEFTNTWCIGFTQMNLSGVGCPDLGSLLLMPTAGSVEVDFNNYAARLYGQQASAGYYRADVGEGRIKAEMTTTRRSTRSRYTFHAGQNNILLNVGKGLSTESGGMVRRTSASQVEGFRLIGDFCFDRPQQVMPVYFVARVSRTPDAVRYWKKQPQLPKGFSSSRYNNAYKVYDLYNGPLAGDEVGVAWSFDCAEDEAIEVSLGISYLSIENARQNLDAEQPAGRSFEDIQASAVAEWNKVLGVVKLTGGTPDQQTQFYTALYHNWIHPNTLSDTNREFPRMGSGERTQLAADRAERLTMFSGWDVYRITPFIGAWFFPERQALMANTMMDMYRENGSLPKFEVLGRDFEVMEGDAAVPYMSACYFLGLTKGINPDELYQAMLQNVMGETYVRGKQDFYNKNFYIPWEKQYDNSVSKALEFYIADWSLAQVAQKLGRTADHTLLMQRAMGYKKYFDPNYGLLRPVKPDGTFMEGFNPLEGQNWEPVNGFHEGTSWNYSFAIPYDVPGLIKLFGSSKRFVAALQTCFEQGYFDMSNEPDMVYPYLFSFVKGEEWRTQYWVNECLTNYFGNRPGGLPGNDDAGTMSAWQMLSMMGFYPTCPAKTEYVLTTPTFDRVEIALDPRYSGGNKKLTIEAIGRTAENIYIDRIELDGKPYRNYSISHDRLMGASKLTIYCTSKPRK